jgi:hypothetical protein
MLIRKSFTAFMFILKILKYRACKYKITLKHSQIIQYF